MLEKAPGAPKLGYLVPERYSPISKERPLPRELPRGSHQEAQHASVARFAPDTAEPRQKSGFFDGVMDWGSWGGGAMLGHIAKHLWETFLEGMVYAAALFIGVLLSKFALFAPLVSLLGPAFVPTAALIMSIVGFTFYNLFFMKGYDRMKRDVLGYERIKKLNKHWWYRWFIDPLVRVGLCALDPIDYVLYTREGSYNGMSKTDWLNFTVSTIVANVVALSGVGLILRAFSLF